MSLESIFERKLQEARERGDLSDTTRGTAFDFDPADGVPEEERMAMLLLKQAGYAPSWIEDDKGLRGKLEETRKYLSRAFSRYHRRMRQAEEAAQRMAAEDEWKFARTHFEGMVAEFNREIFLFNLRAPSLAVQRLPMRASEEYAALGIRA